MDITDFDSMERESADRWEDEFLTSASDNEQTPKIPVMTESEFVVKAKAVFEEIQQAYSDHWKDREDDDTEENMCDRCGGFLYTEEGGDIVTCRSCNGTGQNLERVFDAEGFMEELESTIMFGDDKFLDCLHCEIKQS